MLLWGISTIKEKIIIFADSKRLVQQIEATLVAAEHNVTSLHGDKPQWERDKSYTAFKAGEKQILVATDVASRGLDIADVAFVVNYDCPKEIQDYVHRIGRTGRVGRNGTAITFYNNRNSRIAQPLVELLKEAK